MDIEVHGQLSKTGRGVVVHRLVAPSVLVTVLGVELTSAEVVKVARDLFDTGHDDGTPALPAEPN
jgi:hypothetical protein